MLLCLHVLDRLRSQIRPRKRRQPTGLNVHAEASATQASKTVACTPKPRGQHLLPTSWMLPSGPSHRPAANLNSRTMPTSGCTCRPTATMQISTDTGETAHRQPTNAPCTSDKPKTTPCRQTGAATGLPQPWLLQAAAAQAVRRT